mgnify:CR=1 FL=1
MKNLLLAFAFIGFMATSYANTITSSTSKVMFECDEDDKCDKTDCKHENKAQCYKKNEKKAYIRPAYKKIIQMILSFYFFLKSID